MKRSQATNVNFAKMLPDNTNLSPLLLQFNIYISIGVDVIAFVYYTLTCIFMRCCSAFSAEKMQYNLHICF